MPINVGEFSDLVEMHLGQAGVNRDSISPKLIRKVINLKLRDFARRSGVLSSKVTISSIADKQEYELVEDAIHITKVNFDGSIAYKIKFEDVDVLAEDLS